MRTGRSLLLVAAVHLSIHNVSFCEQGPAVVGESTAPVKLPEDEAKRVEAMEDAIQQLREDAGYIDAIPLARELMSIHRRYQGEQWWTTVGAKRLIETLEKISLLPVNAQRDLAEADAADSQIDDQIERGAYDDALVLIENQEAVRLKWLGALHTDMAHCITRKAHLLEERGNYDEAQAIHRRALAIYKSAYGEHHPTVAVSLDYLASTLQSEGDFAGAESLYRDALELRRILFGEAHLQVATALNNLGALLEAKGDYQDAEALHRKALVIYRAGGNESLGSLAASLNNLAQTLNSQGRYSAAEPFYRESLETSRRVYGDEHPHIASFMHNQATLLYLRGDYDSAEPLYRESLAMLRRIFGNEHQNVHVFLNNFAMLMQAKGDYVAAEQMYREALMLTRSLVGNDHPSVAANLDNLALLLKAKGNLAEAEQLCRQALAIDRKFHGPNHPYVAITSHNLARLLEAKGDYQGAEPLFLQALEITRQALGERHPQMVSATMSVGVLYYRMKEFTKAEPFLRQALELSRDTLGNHHPAVGYAVNNLAVLLQDKGNLEEAEVLLREALANRRKLLGNYHPSVATSIFNLAGVRERQNDYQGSERLLREALGIAERQRSQVVGNELARASFSGVLRLHKIAASLGETLIRLDRAEDAFDILERGRGRAVLDLLARSERDLVADARRRGDAEFAEVLDSLLLAETEARKALREAEAQVQAAAKTLDTPEGATTASNSGLQQGVIRRRLELFDAEAKVLARLRDVWPDAQPATVEEVRRCLEPGERVLVFNWTANAVSLLVVPPIDEGDVRGMIAVDGKHNVEVLAELVRSCTRRMARGPARASDAGKNAQEGQRLFDTLIPKAIRKDLLSAVRVVVVADGPLYRLPFESMVVQIGSPADGSDGRVLWLTAGPPTVYADSATLYINRRKQQDKHSAQRGERGLSALVVGDPVFQPERIGAIPPRKGVLVMSVTDGSNAATAGLQRGDVLTSYNATSIANVRDLKDELKRANAVAGSDVKGPNASVPVTYWRSDETHETTVAPGKLGVRLSRSSPAEGLVLLGLVTRSADHKMADVSALDQIRLHGGELHALPGTRNEANAIAQIIRAAGGTSTLLLGEDANVGKIEAAVSGQRFVHLATHGLTGSPARPYDASLALSRPVVPSLDDNGFLTLDRLIRHWRKKLAKCDLVVLSACSTQHGITMGDSTMGLPLGFMYAGAPSVVASLWKVDDNSTTLLMQRFFEDLLGQYEQPRGSFDGGEAMPKAEALQEAKAWLATLTSAQAQALHQRGGLGTSKLSRVESIGHLDYSDPYFWAGFVLIGDPG